MAQSNKYIITYVDEITKFYFFSRFDFIFRKKGFRLCIMTNRISIWLQCLRKSIKCQLIFTTNKNHLEYTANFQPLEYLGSFLDLADTIRLYNSTYNECIKLNDKNSIQFSFIFGGISAPTIALKDFSDKFNIGKIFFELSNIPGKIFVDSEGTNAHSLLYNNPLTLDLTPEVEEEEYIKWKKKYIEIRGGNYIPAQAQNKNRFYYGYIFDVIGFKLLKIPSEEDTNILQKIKQKFGVKFSKIKYDSLNIEEKFVFFPLQVSHDSQLLIHSSYDNRLGILKAIEIAENMKLELVVKIHPAETSLENIESILKMQEKLGFKIVESNAFDLIRSAELVVTINSSAGLEALILEKSVVGAGRFKAITMASQYQDQYHPNLSRN